MAWHDSIIDQLFGESKAFWEEGLHGQGSVDQMMGEGLIANMRKDSLIDKLMAQRDTLNISSETDTSSQGFGVGMPSTTGFGLSAQLGLKRRKKKKMLEMLDMEE